MCSSVSPVSRNGPLRNQKPPQSRCRACAAPSSLPGPWRPPTCVLPFCVFPRLWWSAGHRVHSLPRGGRLYAVVRPLPQPRPGVSPGARLQSVPAPSRRQPHWAGVSRALPFLHVVENPHQGDNGQRSAVRAATLGQSPASSSACLPRLHHAPRRSQLASLSLPPRLVSRPTPTASVRPLLQNWVTRWHLCCSQASLVPPPMSRALGARSGQVKTLRVVGLGTPRSHTHLPRQPGGGQPCECAQCPQTTHLHVAEGGDFMPCVLHRDKKYF